MYVLTVTASSSTYVACVLSVHSLLELDYFCTYQCHATLPRGHNRGDICEDLPIFLTFNFRGGGQPAKSNPRLNYSFWVVLTTEER